MGSSLTQQDAARLMYAAGQWAGASQQEGFWSAGTGRSDLRSAAIKNKAAEKAFADLISTLVEPE